MLNIITNSILVDCFLFFKIQSRLWSIGSRHSSSPWRSCSGKATTCTFFKSLSIIVTIYSFLILFRLIVFSKFFFVIVLNIRAKFNGRSSRCSFTNMHKLSIKIRSFKILHFRHWGFPLFLQKKFIYIIFNLLIGFIILVLCRIHITIDVDEFSWVNWVIIKSNLRNRPNMRRRFSLKNNFI